MTDELLKLLAGVGHVLDTPGALLRGVLSGQPGQRASGREMLESWGLPENEPGLDMGDVLGFGTEAILDPLGWIPPVNAAKLAMQPGKAARLLGITEELGALPTRQIEEALGVSPTLMTTPEVISGYSDFQKSLRPEEVDAFRAMNRDRGIIEKIMDVPGVRHSPEVIPGTRIPPLRSATAVEKEIFPYLDSAIARSAAPADMMAYSPLDTLGFRGEVNPENIDKFVGTTVGSRLYPDFETSPFSTIWLNDPEQPLVNLLIPKGSQAAYSKATNPLTLPFQSEFEINRVVDRPVAKIGGQYHALDPTGRPFPTGGMYSSPEARQVWQPGFADWIGQIEKSGKVPEFVPPELLKEGWEKYVSEPEMQKNIIARLVGRSPIPDAAPATRRITPEELKQALQDALQHSVVSSRIPSHTFMGQLARNKLDNLGKETSSLYTNDLHADFSDFAIGEDADVGNLNRSIPVNPSGRVHVTGEDPSRHMEIDPMAISDFAAEHLTPGVKVKFHNASSGPVPGKLNPHFFGTVKNQVNDVVYDAEAFKKAKELESEIRERENELFFRGRAKPKPQASEPSEPTDDLILELGDPLGPGFTEEDVQFAKEGLDHYYDMLDAHEAKYTRPVAVELEDGRTVTFLPRGKSDPLWGATAYLTPEQALRADNLRILKGGQLYTPLLAALLGGSGAVLSKLDHED